MTAGEVLHRYLLGMGGMKMHLGISAVSLARYQLLSRCGQRSRDDQRAGSSFPLGPQVLCCWLQQDWAEVLCEGEVWKTQLRRRGGCGKEERAEGRRQNVKF